MASLHFKGKSAVWNHHLSVPYHTLEKDKDSSINGDGDVENLIVEGDNLIALKALLPKYQNRVKCIYIDPPYNTGNEGWVYNDNVNNPLINTWVGQTVGKEGEDFTRHDKWLCMMAPRLKLLRELLSDDGVIFVSIDDNEVGNLRVLMEECFPSGFISQMSWKGKQGAEDDTYYRILHEHILVFAKNKDRFVSGKDVNEQTYPKFDPIKQRNYKTQLLRKWGNNSRRQDRPKLFYSIQDDSGVEFFPMLPDGTEGCWRWGKETMQKAIEEGLVEFSSGRNGRKEAYEKIYEPSQDEEANTKKYNTWLDDCGTTSDGTEEIMSLFEGVKIFNYPKPSTLIKKLIKMSGAKNDAIILDSFAGSGTTAQAVLELNKEDEATRKFILIQIQEQIQEGKPAHDAGYKWVHEITRERVKRVVIANEQDTGFSYFKLGSPIDAENILSGNLPSYNEFAKYVYYLATGRSLEAESKIRQKDYFVGSENGESVYLLYNDNIEELKKLAITLDWAKKAHEKDSGRKVVYAPACYLDEDHLAQFNIVFVGIPYNLFERV